MDRHDVVVITGASAGIGRAAAHAFAKRGARIALLARGVDGLNAAKYEVERLGGQALVIPTDIADFDQVMAAATTVERELGPIDIWVNNAMATIFSPVEKISPDEFRRATDVTYHGSVWGIMAALKYMRPRNRGTIVQVGSALAYRSIPLQAPYCGAKSAIRGFIDSLRSELLHDKLDIKITMVQLSAFNTPQFDWARSHMPYQAQPVPPIFQPELAGEAIVKAAYSNRREFAVGFPAIKAMIANKFFPGLIDKILAKRGYEGQMTEEPTDPHRRDNLFEPMRGDFGTHGRFDAIAKQESLQYQLSSKRGPAIAASIAAAAVLLLLLQR